MATGMFRRAESVTLDSSGNGQVELTPPGSTDGWATTTISCLTSTRVKEPVFKLYMNGVSPGNFLEGSYSGSQDTTDTKHVIPAGSSIVGRWEGGDAGAKATLIVVGTFERAGG